MGLSLYAIKTIFKLDIKKNAALTIILCVCEVKQVSKWHENRQNSAIYYILFYFLIFFIFDLYLWKSITFLPLWPGTEFSSMGKHRPNHYEFRIYVGILTTPNIGLTEYRQRIVCHIYFTIRYINYLKSLSSIHFV